jgi:hypothetical protein
MKEITTNYTRFNRANLFNATLNPSINIMKLIDDVTEYQIDSGVKNFNVTNYLFGLYDGYLYDELLQLCVGYPDDICDRVKGVFDMVNQWVE